MKRQIGCLLMATALVRGSLTAGTSPHFVAVEVDPPKVLLLGPVARYSLLVTGTTPGVCSCRQRSSRHGL